MCPNVESKACDIIQERRLLEIALGCVKGSGQGRIKNSPHQGGEKKKQQQKHNNLQITLQINQETNVCLACHPPFHGLDFSKLKTIRSPNQSGRAA